MMSWKSLSRLLSGIRGAYNDINPATLTGAIDVIVVEQPDGSFTSGPFHVRFGKLTALAPADKVVEVYVNGTYVDFLQMRLGSAGDAFFVDADEPHDMNEDDEVAGSSESDVVLTHVWHSGMVRRRRRRARHNTTKSEPDSCGVDYSVLDDSRPQSDGEDISSPDTLVAHFASDSILADNLATGQHMDWPWKEVSRSHRSSFTAIQSHQDESDLLHHHSTQLRGGVYLEDLVTEADPTVKEAYIYPPVHNVQPLGSPSYVTTESTAHCIDAGYRSDGEHSTRSLSPTGIYPHISDLRLSLCGCPTLGTSISDEKFLEHLITYEDFIKDPDAILSNPNLTINLNGRYLNWQVAAPSILSILAFQTELPHRTIRRLEDAHMRKKEVRRSSWFSWGARASEPSTERLPVAGERLPQVTEAFPSDSAVEPDGTGISQNTPVVHVTHQTTAHKRSNRLSSEEITRLQLKPGRNDIEFRVTTKYQGTCICSASIFVWHWSDRIVISDVDGTITRSDVLGHLLPMLGQDWTHSGVASLYNRIALNGYRFIYLSARALGQAGITRSYLRHLAQDDIHLPDGPILLSPSSLLHAIHQEVIEKKPEVFKIRCLADVCSLFPEDCRPLYAGFGNKTNDVHAYEQAGVQRCRIFTINPRGEVRNEFHPSKLSSYVELSAMVDHYFPILNKSSTLVSEQTSAKSSTQNEVSTHLSPVDLSMYSTFTFWRAPEMVDDSIVPANES